MACASAGQQQPAFRPCTGTPELSWQAAPAASCLEPELSQQVEAASRAAATGGATRQDVPHLKRPGGQSNGTNTASLNNPTCRQFRVPNSIFA